MDDPRSNQKRTTKEDPTAHLNKDKNIAHLERLLHQSIIGFHHLFDHKSVAEILKVPTEKIDFFTTENMDIIQKLFDRLIQKHSVEEKRAYIDSLKPKEFEILLRTYFHIVDSTIMSGEHIKH
jgi:hypothetical protein